MPSSYQKRRTPRTPWRVIVSILLIGMVLYNPFMGMAHLEDNPSYDNLARNRATVGASELQHFCPVSKGTPQPDAEVEARNAEPATTMVSYPLEMVQREESPRRPELFAAVWFRPPPTQ